MTHTCYVSPPETPEWFHVHDSYGSSISMAFDGRSIFSAPEEVRNDAYNLSYGDPSVHWRLATVDEASRALFATFTEEGFE